MQADLILKNALVFSSCDKRFTQADVAVFQGRILYVGPSESLKAKEIFDAGGKYLIPGLIDIHLHVESSMVGPAAFSRGLLRNGVTTAVSEPHEIANVFGVRGVLSMITASHRCDADFFFGVPSSVPSSDFETTGGKIGIPELERLLADDRVICLGEVMDCFSLIRRPDSRIGKLLRHVKACHPSLVIEGHCPRFSGTDLSQVLFAGVDSDHTQQTVESMEERMQNGMFVEIQEKSITSELIGFLARNDRTGLFSFVTDDRMANDFLAKGHLNGLLAKAVQLGMRPEDAVYAATRSPAARMRLSDRGEIAPGKIADFVLLDNLHSFQPLSVYKCGREVYNRMEPEPEPGSYREFPEDFYQSIHLKKLSAGDFSVSVPGAEQVECRVITVKSGTTFTEESRVAVPVRNGELNWEESPCCLAAVFERYTGSGARSFGLVNGDTLKRGAVATSYAHDHHNLLVLGRNPSDMALAANRVIEEGGGIFVADRGRVLAGVPLPVGGILSQKPLSEVGKGCGELVDAIRSLGCRHSNPIMSISTLGLPVSPSLKLTDRGLVDTKRAEIVDLICKNGKK